MLIYGSLIRPAIAAILLCVTLSFASAQEDPSQRPLPLPERGVADLPQHMELLKRLRSLVESQQKNSEPRQNQSDTLPRLPKLPSPADATSSRQNSIEAAPAESAIQPQHLQQFQDALKNLASQLPPGFVPPDLSSVPPDQLRKAMENPAVQQQMKQMLEQFAKDGVLPKSSGNGSQLPVPPTNDGGQNDVPQSNLSQKMDSKNEPIENTLNKRPSPGTRNERSDASEKSNPSELARPNPVDDDRDTEDRSPKSGEQSSRDPDDSKTRDSSSADSTTPDAAKDAPPGSMRSLRSFLKKLAEDTGITSPEASKAPSTSTPTTPSLEEPDSRPRDTTDEQAMPTEPSHSPSNTSPSNSSSSSTRRPLRKRDGVKPKAAPSSDSSISPAPQSKVNPTEQFPETSPNPLNPPDRIPRGNEFENTPETDSSKDNSVSSSRSPFNPAQGLRVDPETAKKQLEELQKTLERMKQLAENSDTLRSPTEEMPSSNSFDSPGPENRRPPSQRSPNESIPNKANQNEPRANSQGTDASSVPGTRGSDSNSVVPPSGQNNRIANRPDLDNLNGEQLPESLPDVDEFLREQLKDFKLPPNAFRGSNSGSNSLDGSSSPGMNSNQQVPDRRISGDSIPRNMSPDEIQRIVNNLRGGNANRLENANRPGNDPSTQGNAKSEKPPMDIAKELEQRGFGNTLKQLVERAKEEAKKPRPPAQNSTDSQGLADNTGGNKSAIEKALNSATGAAKKADPELSKSMAKMLDGLKDDLVEIAKDARFNDRPDRSRGDRSMPRPSPSESNSLLDGLRKSASEILAGPSRSPNSRNSTIASTASTASSAFSGEFDVTPVLVLAGILAALAIVFFGLRHVKVRSANAAELQFAGPPLKPSDINTRADVVRAFHEFAMRSAQSVQSWWTHRTVQQAILERAPEYRAAVETLANTYEQARYFPAEQELTPEQLESARSALQQCSRKNSNG